jgi:ATP-dependent Clp protease ATP-binding subunit ClpA
VLESLGITIDRVRVELVRVGGSGSKVPDGQIPFTPRAKKVLELALREALSLHHDYIGTEHILLALVREKECVAARILLDLNADPETVRNAVVTILFEPGAVPEALPPDAPQTSRWRFAATRRRLMQGVESAVEPGFSVGPSPDLVRLLMAAGARSLDEGRTLIEVDDLLLALPSNETAAAVLAELGIDRSALRAAVERDPAK